MIDVETGNIIWTANHFKKGDTSALRILGITNGPTEVELTREICAEIVLSLKSQIQQASYELDSGDNHQEAGNVPFMVSDDEKAFR